jgi:hypothetical protein
MLKRLAFFLTLLGAALPLLLSGTPASAQATRTWVSGVGDDANPCSRTAPCKTFAGAISKTAIDGQIDCLDPGGFGALTITKSITIDCHEIFGSILVTGTPGITIIADSAPNVRIRNMNFTGLGTGTNAIRITGSTVANTKVYLQDIWIDDFNARGVSDERTNGGQLYIGNTQINNIVGAAVSLAGSSTVQVSIDSSRLLASGFGVSAGPNANIMINRTIISGNNIGVDCEGASINVDNSVISANGTGLNQTAGTIKLSNTDVVFNITAAVAGTVMSYTNNRFTGTIGGTITAIGSTSNPTGQQ